MHSLDPLLIDPIIRAALAEDVGPGDLTTRTVVADRARAQACLEARAEGVVAGVPVAARVFELVDATLTVEPLVGEGSRTRHGQRLLSIRGSAASILTGERTALNFLSHLSGIATLAASVAERTAGSRTRVLDTRKTVPGLRLLARYACRVGGIGNHRLGLYDAVLIKNNHLKFVGPAEAVRRARASAPSTATVEIEVETLEQLQEALTEKPDIIMLDNMDDATIQKALGLIAGRARVEASGSVTPERVHALSALGVDYISMGRITHSAPALDISLRIEEVLAL
ncbi:MAG: carboxylating nicotinate-nucleotide diphosphorylase [Candidatus Xenobia bacterium]